MPVHEDYIEHCLERLQTIFSSTSSIKSILTEGRNSSQLDQERAALIHHENLLDELLHKLSEVNTYLDGYLDNLRVHESSPYSAHTIQTGQRGRPKFDVTSEQLDYLVSLSFSWSTIANILGISRMTLYRRRIEHGMRQRGRSIGNDELRTLLRYMRSEFPNIGEVMVLGRLRSLGYGVTRSRVRTAIRQTDPINTALRALTGPTARRIYSVPGPNSLWHMGMFNVL